MKRCFHICSISLKPRDVIIAFDITYQAVLYAARLACKRAGAELITIPMSFPVTTQSVLSDLEKFLVARTSTDGKIRLCILQHITSPTAIVLPVKHLTRACHKLGIPVLIDGAHAIGQLPLALEDLGADYYVTNGHKWLCSPRGSAILYVRRDRHADLNPLVTTWGHPHSDSITARFIWQGTTDYSSLLALHITLRFWEWLGYDRTIERNAQLARWCGRVLAEAWGTDLLVKDGEMTKCSMATVRVPGPFTPLAEGSEEIPLGDLLFKKHAIEVPVFSFRNARWVRISLHMYNDKEDCLLLGKSVLETMGYPKSYWGYAVLDMAREEIGPHL
ncbi:hypothetical protein HDU86_007481 [Geranomyces michiganensis]|nr:hypothetical protein HDU86_007481 [Geranomyces michiganensis]